MTQKDEIRQVQEAARTIRQNVSRVIVGKEAVIDLLMVALLCEGHVLFEDVPGIGKTMLAKALAKSLGCSFQRIQFTPDLLPSDITGITFYNQKKGEFEFRPGPLVAQVVLADEINRATPRTQSALLEAMEERQILQRFREEQPLQELQPVVAAVRLQTLQQLIRQVRVEPGIENYIVELVRATRTHSAIELGVSPRGTLALYRASQAYAAVSGRNYTIPDDVKHLARAVLSHRMIATKQARLHGRVMEQIVDDVLHSVAVPVES